MDVSLTCKQFFLSVAHKSVSDLPFTDICPLSYTSTDVLVMHLAEVNLQDISEITCKLNSYKAVGVDPIPTKLSKHHLLAWPHFLCNLFIKVILLLFSQLAGKLPMLHLF